MNKFAYKFKVGDKISFGLEIFEVIGLDDMKMEYILCARKAISFHLNRHFVELYFKEVVVNALQCH